LRPPRAGVILYRMSEEAPASERPVRRLGARMYLIAAVFLFVIPGIVGGAVWWLYAQKAAVDRAFTRPLREFKGHTGMVWSVAIIPDGRRALSGSDDETLRLWNLETGEMVREFKGRTRSALSVAISPDGRRAVSGGLDGTIRLWNLETGETVRKLKGHMDLVRSVAISPDGHRALSGGVDGTVRLWDLESGKLIRQFALPAREGMRGRVIWSVAVSTDGRRALSGGYWVDAGGEEHAELLLWRVPSDFELKVWRLFGGKLPEPPEDEE